jgi:methyl-accepting chemotaxis protein
LTPEILPRNNDIGQIFLHGKIILELSMAWLHRVPLLWKVLSAPILAMVCLALYLVATVTVFEQNNARLSALREVQVPVLGATQDNLTGLDKIIDNLNSAASDGEAEPIQAADALAAQVRTNYARL